MRLLHPELLALALLAPATAWLAARAWRRRRSAAEAWAARGLWDRLFEGWSFPRVILSVTLLSMAVLGAVLALAQPRWGTSAETVEREGVDVVYLLDTSLSMGARDVPPSRLTAAGTLVRRLIQRMPENRAALVGVEGDSVVLAPLTTDAGVVDLVLDGLVPGTLPIPGTALGEALDLLPELFPPGGDRHRAAVLLSDGEDHGGGLGPRLDALAKAGIVVHTLGVGTPEGAPVPRPGSAGRADSGASFKHREDGTVVVSTLHEQVLEEIARRTGGVYLQAADGGRDLTALLAAIGAMDRRTLQTRAVDTEAERFQWPLAVSAAALLLYLAVPPFRPGPPGGRP